MELGGKFSGKEAPEGLNPSPSVGLNMIAGSGLIAAAKDKLRRVGTTPGLTTTFVEVAVDTETGKVNIVKDACASSMSARSSSAGFGQPDPRRPDDGYRHGDLERHVYDPKLGTADQPLLFNQGKPPTYLDIPPDIAWRRSKRPIRSTRWASRASANRAGLGRLRLTSAISDALGGHLFNRTPVRST